METLAAQWRALGLTPEAMRTLSPRHAALRDDAAARLIHLFRDGGACDAAGLPVPEELLTEAGRARYRLDVIRELFLFSDWPDEARDTVRPSGETTAILWRAADQMVRGGSALDLGCGSGALALLLAGRCERVVATDINRRALELTALNARVNGVENVAWREGSLWEPLRGERFDWIVSQPPYLPRPSIGDAQVFLHGGARGDELAIELLCGIAAHLMPGGRAFVFSDWPLAEGEALRDRLPALPLRARVFRSRGIVPEAYARSYGLDAGRSWQGQEIASIVQALCVLEAGSGIEEIEVLPQDWGGIEIG